MDIAILLCNNYPKIVINGAIIDVFEYYFAILEHNKNIKLYLIDFTDEFTNHLISLMEERYYLDDLKWKENIVHIKRFNIITHIFEKVLIIDYSTISRLKGLLRSKEIIVISELYTDDPNYFMGTDKYNIKYYGEMPLSLIHI